MTQSPINNLIDALKTNEGYLISWEANIAMAYIDAESEYKRTTKKKYLTKNDKILIANQAAKNFIKNLCS